MPYVVMLSGAAKGKAIRLEGPVTIGRHKSCELVIRLAQISRRHARIVPVGDGWVVSDLGTQNGTQVNGQNITEHQLVDGDEISISSVQMRYRDEKAVIAAGAAAGNVGRASDDALPASLVAGAASSVPAPAGPPAIPSPPAPAVRPVAAPASPPASAPPYKVASPAMTSKTSTDNADHDDDDTNRSPMPGVPHPAPAPAPKPKVDAPMAGTGIRFGLGTLGKSGDAPAASASDAHESTAFMDMSALLSGDKEATEFIDMKELMIGEERPTLPKGPLLVMGGLIAVLGVVLAVLVGTRTPPVEPTRLPNLVIERGDKLIYTYPPFDTYSLDNPLVVTVLDQGNGLVQLVGTHEGIAEIRMDVTENDKKVVYVGRIEVMLPIDNVICDEIRSEHQQLPPTGRKNMAAEFLSRARGLYQTRAQHDQNLFKAFLYSRQSWCLLEQLGGQSAIQIDAKDLMDKSKAELEARFKETSNIVQQLISIKDWKSLKVKLDFLLRLLPDQRDWRNQRARKLMDFYGEFMPKD